MRSAMGLALLWLTSTALAADPADYQFNFVVKMGDDGKPVALHDALPSASTHRLPVTDHLAFEIETPTGNERFPMTSVTLIDDSSGTPITLTQRRDNRPASVQRAHSFVVCGQRVIVQSPAPPTLARCADLPRLAKPDPVIDRCFDCDGPYEGMPEKITARSRIAPVDEPGEALVLTGRALDADGKPRSGVIVYAYHTNAGGIYPEPSPPRSTASNHHGKLRGWTKTDAAGRYTFETIRPAGYPNPSGDPRRGEPQHIHMHVIEPGCATYFIDELLFTDDPRLTPELRERMSSGRGGNGIVTPQRDGKGTWQVVRDIHLGEKIPGYPGCR